MTTRTVLDADPLRHLLDVLSRRGTLEVFRTLLGGPVAERALVRRVGAVADSVVVQRLSDLRGIGAVELVPETGDLRLSPAGRRLQGILDHLEDWASTDG